MGVIATGVFIAPQNKYYYILPESRSCVIIFNVSFLNSVVSYMMVGTLSALLIWGCLTFIGYL